MNCGIADAHNLAYKISLVHRGIASPSILSTYTAERRSVADMYSRQSVKNGQEIFGLLQSLKTAGVEDVVQARKNMMAALANPEQRARVDEGIERQREHFDNVSTWTLSVFVFHTDLSGLKLELHIGYVYGASKPPPHASDYHPKFVPGARLPHAWISFLKEPHSMNGEIAHPALQMEPVDLSYVTELDDAEMQACQWSTLDLCGRASWTLIVGRTETNSNISQFRQFCDSVGIHLQIWILGVDFAVVRQAWFSEELSRGRGLLVRPDQHVMMRVTETVTGNDMIAELNSHLGRAA